MRRPHPARSPRAWFLRSQAPDGTELQETPDLGYTFDPSSWGHGYATEAARCVFDYARARISNGHGSCRSFIRTTRDRCAWPSDPACGMTGKWTLTSR